MNTSYIRLASKKDTGQINSLYTTLLEKKAMLSPEQDWQPNWQSGVYPTIETAIEKMAANELFVLESQGLICAAMVLNHEQADVYGTISWQYPAKFREVLVIHTLCVHPACSRMGYGAQMVNYAKQFAGETGCTVIRFDTYRENIPALNLYRKS